MLVVYLCLLAYCRKLGIPRNESGISLASGIYEEIPDDHEYISGASNTKHASHVYENPSDVIIELRKKFFFTPPPLPPRSADFGWLK